MKDISEHEKDCDCSRCLWDRLEGKPMQPTRLMVSPKQYNLIEKHGFIEGMIKSLTTKDK